MFGRGYTHLTFLSTTLSKDLYAMEDIKKVRITIKLFANKGANRTYLPEVNENFPEYELLFKAGVKLKVIGLLSF